MNIHLLSSAGWFLLSGFHKCFSLLSTYNTRINIWQTNKQKINKTHSYIVRNLYYPSCTNHLPILWSGITCCSTSMGISAYIAHRTATRVGSCQEQPVISSCFPFYPSCFLSYLTLPAPLKYILYIFTFVF